MPDNAAFNDQNILAPLIHVTRELTNIISEEITLLKTNRPKDVEKLLPRKNQLMASYHKEMTELSVRGGLPAMGNGAAIRDLKHVSRKFQSVLTRHTRLVKTLKQISENMIQAISEEVVRNQNQASRYGADGTRSTNKSPTSISLNQTV